MKLWNLTPMDRLVLVGLVLGLLVQWGIVVLAYGTEAGSILAQWVCTPCLSDLMGRKP